MGRPLFFCHIPKTAGTSVRLALEGQFKPHEILPDAMMMARQGGHYPASDIVAASLAKQRDSIRMVRGHYHISFAELLDDPIIITVLREPISRTISNIRHVIRSGSWTVERVMRTLDEGKLPFEANLMTRYLSGNDISRVMARMKQPWDFLTDPIQYPEVALRSAIGRLQRIDCLGVVERLDSFAASIKETIGIDLTLSHANSSPEGALDLSAGQLSVIRKHNQLDMRLYRAAIDHLDRKAPTTLRVRRVLSDWLL